MRVVIVTMDNHLAGAVERARATLARELPGLDLCLHAAADWGRDGTALERCRADIAQGHIVVATMLFMEDHIQAASRRSRRAARRATRWSAACRPARSCA